MVDLEELIACTGARQDRAERALDGLNKAMHMYDIHTAPRTGMFLANIGHETKGLKWLAELGDDEYLNRYNWRLDLGNTEAGDGPRFKGRGMLQTTGRANYGKLTDRLRARFPQDEIPDFVATPEMLERPEWAAISAADYVGMRNLNAKADAGDFLAYCIGINGRNRSTGLPNGWAERCDLWVAAQRALA